MTIGPSSLALWGARPVPVAPLGRRSLALEDPLHVVHVLLRQLERRTLFITIIALDDAVDRPLIIPDHREALIDRRVPAAPLHARAVVALAVLHVQMGNAIV